jgi:peptidyl-prolyl cis-trans isomerase-like 2
MANKGPGTNGYVPIHIGSLQILKYSVSSQFYITFRATPTLDKKHTVFGKLVGGEDILDLLEKLPVRPGTERPAKPVRITEIVM